MIRPRTSATARRAAPTRSARRAATTVALAITLAGGGTLSAMAAVPAAGAPTTAPHAAAGQAAVEASALATRRGKDRHRDPDPHTPIPAQVQSQAAQKDAAGAAGAAAAGASAETTGVVVGGGGPLSNPPAGAPAKVSAAAQSAATASPSAMAAAGLPAQVVLGYAQQPQQNSYYCGPAAVAQALALVGINRPQSEVAERLRTDAAGYQTSWSGTFTWYYAPDVGSTKRPVADVMGSYMYGYGRTGRYYSAELPMDPSAADIATYQRRLVSDTASGYPLIGDAWEMQGEGNLRLPGHPAVFPNTSYDVFHWYTIHGYENYGATSYITDSAAGSPYVSWSTTIPRYSKVDSGTLTLINGGRGYVW
ncbi:MAG: C39 family peptidase [Austwickia sp.]|jgi:hypothetical protein|nr:MAG: C39 family peptidase [Austwickia sp.]